MENEGRCPLCGEKNQCQRLDAEAAQSCWCYKEPFPAELLAQSKPANCCICLNCLEAFRQSKAVDK